MSFIASYKRLEQICEERIDEERRVSAYIDQMINIPDGASYVDGWYEDLKRLKHCRWARNKIVHEPGCNDQNTCEPGDIQWVDSFYLRMVKGTDPLSMYARAKKSGKKMKASAPVRSLAQPRKNYSKGKSKQSKSKLAKIVTTLVIILIVLLVILIAVVTAKAAAVPSLMISDNFDVLATRLTPLL